MPPPTSAEETAPAPSRSWSAVLGPLPTGDSLSHQDWLRRHVWICRLLWAHVLLVPAYGILRGEGVDHALLEGGVLIAGLSLVASARRFDVSLRSLAATLGLVSCSALLVHFSGGLIETHSTSLWW